MKQIGLGIQQYAQDYDEYMAPGYIGATGANIVGSKSWVVVTYPYIKSTQVYRCPSETKAEGTAYPNRALRDQLDPTKVMTLPVHYSYNIYVGGGDPSSGSSPADYRVGREFGFKKLSWIVNPSAVIAIADAGTIPPWKETASALPDNAPVTEWKRRLSNDSTSVPSNSLQSTSYLLVHPQSGNLSDTLTSFGTMAARHFDTTNILWADGHVKAVKPERVQRMGDFPSEYTTSLNTCFNPGMGCNNL